MNYRLACILVLVVSVLCGGCASAPDRVVQRDAGAGGLPADFNPMQFNARMVLVTVPLAPEHVVLAVAEAIADDYGIRLMDSFPLNTIGEECIAYAVQGERPIDAIIADLRADERVETAQINQVFDGLLATYSDPYAELQHGANAIGAPAAHQVSTGRGVKIAVIDTGVDTTHPDLAGRVIETENFVQKGKLTFNKDPHGTGVAGVIAALADNKEGIFGVAPDAQLLAVKACGYAANGDSAAVCSSWSLAQAIDFAVLAGAQIINLSLAGPEDTLVARMIAQAHARDITIVASALGDEQGPGFPASMDAVISVLASDADGNVPVPAWHTDAPCWVFAAPGADIVTTAPDAGYHFLSGSSLSAAHVSGVVALLLQHAPSMKPQDIRQVLERTALEAPVPAGTSGVGFLDVCAALQEIVPGAACG